MSQVVGLRGGARSPLRTCLHTISREKYSELCDCWARPGFLKARRRRFLGPSAKNSQGEEQRLICAKSSDHARLQRSVLPIKGRDPVCSARNCFAIDDAGS
jgi:hypothetical protein